MQIVLINLRVIYFAPMDTKSTITIERKPGLKQLVIKVKETPLTKAEKNVICCVVMTFGFLELHTKSKRE